MFIGHVLLPSSPPFDKEFIFLHLLLLIGSCVPTAPFRAR